MIKFTLSVLALSLIISCQADNNPAQGDWIKGTESEKLEIIEKQFRGFDNAMVETGYRYQELYWAGQDENWNYANYQLEKIEKTIKNGLERRPKRGKSAEYFLELSLPEMEESIASEDTVLFNRQFQLLTNSCNKCHSDEKVPFFHVKTPVERLSPIRK